MSLRDVIRQAADELRSWGAVAVIGSGASFPAGFPLNRQLTALLWHAIDADKQLCKDLARRFSSKGRNGKHVIGDDQERICVAYEGVKRSVLARQAFQRGFAYLDSERGREPSVAHDALAELVHRGCVNRVVSLNWDTLLERAYRHRYGVSINVEKPILGKPHGDAADPGSDWVLPNEPGNIPDELVQEIHDMAKSRPRCLLIIGYSERDENVVERLIQPLSDRWRVIRIGPGVQGELGIPVTAEQALPQLVKVAFPQPEAVGWEHVTFEPQHDLANAIAGYRLGPADVKACPRLPEVSVVHALLQSTKGVEIVGESGCGKSITAYQAAFDMHRDGWEVLRLFSNVKSLDDPIAAFSNLHHRTLLILDDAQTLDRCISRRLLEFASDRLAVIVVTTDETAIRGRGVHIAGERAVRTLADEFAKRRDKVLSVVQAFDNTIGEGYLDGALEDRLREAAKSGSPWQLNFVLRGGWRTAGREIAVLRDKNRADLLLGAVAAGQIVSLDAGVSEEWLYAVTRAMGRDKDVGSNI